MKYLDYISSISELYQKIIDPVGRKHHLTSVELAILLFLANNPKYDTATDIVQKRHLAKSHVSTSLRSLEEKGLLRKEYRDNNRRTLHLVPEKTSEEIIKEGQAAQAAFLSLLTEGIPAGDSEQMTRTFDRIYDNALRALEDLR